VISWLQLSHRNPATAGRLPSAGREAASLI
jgi:hypothetical protein